MSNAAGCGSADCGPTLLLTSSRIKRQECGFALENAVNARDHIMGTSCCVCRVAARMLAPQARSRAACTARAHQEVTKRRSGVALVGSRCTNSFS